MAEMVHEIEIRVRYQETDGQRRLHHANYLTYREFENEGLFMVVADISCKYHAPADYDDLLRLRTRVEKIGAAHIKHAYELIRGTTILATGTTTVVCVDQEGKVRRLSDWMLT